MTAAVETVPGITSAPHADTYATLVLRAQGGDQAALAVLYESFFDRIYRYVLARIGDVAEAEDVTEETFFRMLRSLTGFRPSPSGEALGFASWLFQIAHNLLVDRFRHRSCQETAFTLLRTSLDHCEITGGPESAPGWDRQDLIDAVQRLSAAQRDVITLRFAASLSLAETAAVLDKHIGNVKVLQHNALANLRRFLADEPAPQRDFACPPAMSHAWARAPSGPR
ncbi:MAG: sigma-70 family RNA polymerase sigma factor [Chloroflexi bacterium]|nr:sigma-70 family RNA polymerase sigma factor [Chloroflexota bacterium]